MITAQVETLANGLDELKPLLPIHWRELATHQDRVPLDPQYDVYLLCELAGGVVYVTLRERGTLIGYFVGFVQRGLHYKQTLECTMDIFYVHPDHRGKLGGRVLFGEVKAELRRRGVQRWAMGLKMHQREHAEELFLHLGFVPNEQYYTMWLE